MTLPGTQDFAEIVAAEASAVKAFVALLGEEAEALRSNSADALERVAAAKEEQAGALEALGRKRQAFFASLGIAENAATVNSWLAAQPPRLADAWRELMRLAEAARELNLANGQCIALLSRDIRARLAAIAGKREGDNSIYNPGKRAGSPFTSPAAAIDTGFRIRDNV